LKRARAGLSAIALSVLLAECPARTPPGVTAIEASGSWRHPASGLVFPDSVGNFRRVSINRYDEAGTDVGVGYNHEVGGELVAFTVYVRPPVTLRTGEPASLEQQFRMEKQVVRSRHPGASESWSRAVALLGEGVPRSGFAAEFGYTETFAGLPQPVVSRLYLFESDGWFIKYRVTFAATAEGAPRRTAEALLRTAPWGAIGGEPSALNAPRW
jgi:hypothetical protein